ncbi:MAG: hypothetical protein RIQ81_1966 [Pseudomonadota bacterium]|jgi:uncharacterized protein YggE
MKQNSLYKWAGAFAASSVFSFTAHAAQAEANTLETPDGLIEVTGSGSASAEPELVRLSISVTSRCNETSIAARDANAILSNKIIEVIERYAAPAADIPGMEPLIATSGANVRQTEYSGYGEDAKVICDNKWRASEWISGIFTDLDKLPAIQDELLRLIDQESVVTGHAQTWAEIAAPNFDLKPETNARLKVEAQQRAWKDALGKVDVFKSACNLEGLRMIRASEPHFSVTPVYKAAALGQPDHSTPMRPGAISVDAEWNFTWGFDPSPNPNCITGTAAAPAFH